MITDNKALIELAERWAKHLEKEAFSLEASAAEKRTLAANIRFEAETASAIEESQQTGGSE